MNLANVSVVVTTCNGEGVLARCLEQLDDFGEVIVVDAFSVDGTVEVARAFGATVFARPYRSPVELKHWAVDRAKHGWVLMLDMNETMSEELKDEIKKLKTVDGISGYWIRRQSSYLGHPVRHCDWGRRYFLSLFRTSRDGGVAGTFPRGKTATLQHELDYPLYAGIEQHFEDISEQTGRWAVHYIADGGRFVVAGMLFGAAFEFFRMYVWKRGWLDGSIGFVLSLLSSYTVFLAFARAWELRRDRHSGNGIAQSGV